MSDPLEKTSNLAERIAATSTNAPGSAGGSLTPPVAKPGASGQSGDAPGPVVLKPSGPPPPPRKPPTIFKFAAGTPEGDEERRLHDAKRKQEDRERERRVVEPPPLPSARASVAGQSQTKVESQNPGGPAPVAEIVIPWTAADVREFTDELVEMSEAKRLKDFCDVAREANMPKSFVDEIEKSCRYPVKSKENLKGAVAAVAAKWLNRTGISARNKEEAALIFCMGTIWMQGRRLKKHMVEQCAAFHAERDKKQKDEPPGNVLPLTTKARL